MEAKFLQEALLSPMTANAFKLGTVLSQGWFWMRPNGCLVLYRGQSIELVDMSNILSVREPDASQVSPPQYVPHKPGSSYFYVLCSVNRCGNQQRSFNAAVKVEIDDSGLLAKPDPNNIFIAKAQQVEGDKVGLSWYYSPLLQESEPIIFKVYYDAGSGEQPLAEIPYQGRKFYRFESDSLAEGTYIFVIKAEDKAGCQNAGAYPLKIQIEKPEAASVDILTAESI